MLPRWARCRTYEKKLALWLAKSLIKWKHTELSAVELLSCLISYQSTHCLHQKTLLFWSEECLQHVCVKNYPQWMNPLPGLPLERLGWTHENPSVAIDNAQISPSKILGLFYSLMNWCGRCLLTISQSASPLNKPFIKKKISTICQLSP